MRLTAEIHGLEGLIRDTARSRKLIKRELKPAAEDAWDNVVDRAQAIVPVLTGRLRASINLRVEQPREWLVVADAGPQDVPYALAVEYESRGGRPYMRPAFDQEHRRATREFGDTLGRAVERAL